MNVEPQSVRGFVPAIAVLFQGFHDDPVQIAAQEAAQRRVPAAPGGDRGSSPVAVSRVLGLGGSSSRMIAGPRREPLLSGVRRSNGVVPVSNS